MTLERILNGEYDLEAINETEYDHIWTVLRLILNELEYKHGKTDLDYVRLKKAQEQMDALIDLHDRRTKLTCSRCGKNASYNTPVTDGAGTILCPRCAEEDDSDTVWYGIEQRRCWDNDMPYHMDPQRLSYYYRGVVIHATQNYHVERNPPGHVTRLLMKKAELEAEHKKLASKNYYSNPRFQFDLPEFVYSCWVKGGQQAVPLNSEEKKMKPEVLLRYLYERYVIGGMYRCTTCKKDFDNPPADRPLFAGVVCAHCAVLHKQHLEDQRKKGQVCRMCGQPYDNCCC